MERIERKPFQGVWNIIRFNWHFYVLAAVMIAVLLAVRTHISYPHLNTLINTLALLVGSSILLSLTVSYYIYDYAGIYCLGWLDVLNIENGKRLVNINAGFDETSVLLANRYKDVSLTVYDFYDPVKHTEVSIKRARRSYPAYAGTKLISTENAGFRKDSADYVFAILAAHEIRDRNERVAFFRQLNESLGADGKIVVVEHLRNLPNLIAYNIGFFHFFSRQEWLRTFREGGLEIEKEIPITPFIRCFIIHKNGIAS